jgi:hypothetical protein
MASHKQFDLTIPTFPAPFKRWLVSNGTMSYKFKCLSYGLVMYLLGAVITIAVNTFDRYVVDYPTAIACAVSSITLYGLVHGCKEVSSTINQLDKRIEHTKDKKFHDFVDFFTNEHCWHGLSDRYWYYLLMLGLIIGLLVGYSSGLFDFPPYVQQAGQNIAWLRPLASLIFSFSSGYAVSSGFFLAHRYAVCINMYCNEFVKPEKARLFPVEEAGGFKSLGKLALRINIASVTPAAYALSVVYRGWIEKGYTLLNRPIYVLCLIIYACALFFIFFHPLVPVHTALVDAKTRAAEHVDEMFERKFSQGITQNAEDFQFLSNLIVTRQYINRVPTWPLSPRLSFGSAISILFPIIGGAILQICFELWLRGAGFF